MENFVVVIEKRRKIGEIEGNDLFVWELFDVMTLLQLKEWCRDRGYSVPFFTYSTIMQEQKVEFSNGMCASLWDVSPRA